MKQAETSPLSTAKQAPAVWLSFIIQHKVRLTVFYDAAVAYTYYCFGAAQQYQD